VGRLKEKVAVVTGGTGGIGLSTAQAFVREGAYVFIIGRRQAELDEAVALIGRNVTGVQGDVSKQSDLDRFYDAVRSAKGHVDCVFANAGIARLATLGTLTDSHIDELFDINVKGVIHTVQKALPHLRPGASIILNASIVGSKGFANWSVYSATKAAVRSFARTWASETSRVETFA
jgi:NAD(P)-dependent dehydrogenase (short-subunit alcohol dehydrogenase family)